MKKSTSRGIVWGMVAGLIAWMVVATSVNAQNGDTVTVNVHESVTFAVPVSDVVAIADPTIANFLPIPEKNLVTVIGVKAGITTLLVVPKAADAKPISRLVKVTDVEAEAKKKEEAEAKRAAEQAVKNAEEAKLALIRTMAGQPGLQIRTIGDTIVLDGQVSTELEAQRAAQVAATYHPKVLNLMEVQKPRQIKVRTRVAEVNVDAIRNMGFKWFGPQGEVQYAFDYTGGGSILHGLVQPQSSIGTAPDSPTELDIGIDVILQLLINKNFARLLSEPTLVTLSGQEATFLVGQEIPIIQQLPQSFTVEFKEVGVRMKVKPVADSANRIHTTIAAEVSQVVGTEPRFGTPIIGSKKANTTLQVNDGQTIVIGGLLENNVSRDFLRKVPWLADIPLFGFLFRQKEFQQAQREVLFFMTPEVVKDVEAEVANAEKTPLMNEWNREKANQDLLPVPNPRDDWGLHNPNGMGFPERKPKEKISEPSATELVPVPAPAPAPAPVEMQPAPAKPVAQPKPQPAPAPVAPAPKPVTQPKPAPVSEPEPAPRPPTTNFVPARPANP